MALLHSQTPNLKWQPTLIHPESTLDGALGIGWQSQSSNFPRTLSEEGILGSITSDGAAMQGKSCSQNLPSRCAVRKEL